MPSDSERPAAARRLHPLSLLFGIGSAARSLVVPGLALLLFARGDSFQPWLMLFFIPVVASYVKRYLTYRYRLAAAELVIRDGLLTTNERHIPYAKIQNIDLIQNPLHRLFKVGVVRLETGSGGAPEAMIRVLSIEAVEEMRARVFRDAGTRAAEPRLASPSLVRLSTRELVIHGLISNRGMVVVAAGLGLLSQSGFFSGEFDRRVEALFKGADWQPQFASGMRGVALVALGVATLIGILLILRLLSVVLSIVKFHGFTLQRHGDDLRAEYGLLTRVSATIPRHRIQLLSVRASRMHRWFRRVSVQVETAGGGGAGQEGTGGERKLWLAPILPRAELPRLVGDVLEGIDIESLDWQPIAARAWRRRFKPALVPVAIVTGVSTWALGFWGLALAVPGVALAYLLSRRWAENTGYALTPDAIVFKSGWWGRNTSAVRLSKIQALSLTQSPFDRRHGMAGVEVDTAGGGLAGHRVAIPYLEEAIARQIQDRLYQAVGATAFRW